MPEHTLNITRAWLGAAVLGCGLAACGEAPAAAPGQENEVHAADTIARAAKPVVRKQSPVLTRLRRALDQGRVEEARALLSEADAAEPEASLLQARTAALSAQDTDAMRSIEVARQAAPLDPSVYATAAEIYSGLGRATLAWGEVVNGEKVCGSSPEFSRARGILSISRSGGAEKGLALLEEARRSDPDIPFIDRALGQAHLLVAKEHAKAKEPRLALEHVRASLAFDPDDIDAARFLSEMLTANGDYKGSIAVLEKLIQRGEPLESELALTLKNAGVAALLGHDREEALDDFVAARKHGLTRDELSSGAWILEQEAQACTDLGVKAYEAQELAAAEEHFRRALVLQPDMLQAENHLAIVLYKKKEYAESVRLWKSVLATARADKIELPEPVHLNLAKAEVQDGDREGARATLQDYLAREPEGEWAADTRAMLDALAVVAKPR